MYRCSKFQVNREKTELELLSKIFNLCYWVVIILVTFVQIEKHVWKNWHQTCIFVNWDSLANNSAHNHKKQVGIWFFMAFLFIYHICTRFSYIVVCLLELMIFICYHAISDVFLLHTLLEKNPFVSNVMWIVIFLDILVPFLSYLGYSVNMVINTKLMWMKVSIFL